MSVAILTIFVEAKWRLLTKQKNIDFEEKMKEFSTKYYQVTEQNANIKHQIAKYKSEVEKYLNKDEKNLNFSVPSNTQAKRMTLEVPSPEVFTFEIPSLTSKYYH